MRRYLPLALLTALLGACSDVAPNVTMPQQAPRTVSLSQTGINLGPKFCSGKGAPSAAADLRAPGGTSFSLASSGSVTPTDANGGEEGSEIYGINEAGWVVGAVYREGMPVPAVKEPGQAWRVLSTDPGYAYDINNLNQIVGFVSPPAGPRAVRWTAAGAATVLGEGAIARAINDAGQIAGTTFATPVQQAFLYSGGTLTPLGTFAGLPTSGYGINASGDVAGAIDEGAPTGVAFVKPFGGAIQPIANPAGYGGGIAYAVNNLGEVVGQVSNAGGEPRAFYVRYTAPASYVLIPTLGGSRNTAFAINASGVVVGSSRDATGSELGFSWNARTGGEPTRLEKLSGGCGSISLTINDCGVIGGVTTFAAALARATLWGACQPSEPRLALVKSAGAASVEAGSPISFTLTLTNSGDAPATGVTLTDALPAGPGLSWTVSPAVAGCTISGSPQALTCSFASLAPSASVSVTVVSATQSASGTVSTSTYGGHTPAPTPSCGVYRNTGRVTASNHGAVSSNEAVTEVKCSTPKLTLVKSAGAASVEAGSPISFTLRLTNSGTAAATGVTLTDALPVGPGLSWSVSPAVAGCTISGSPQALTCSFASLAPSASVSVTVVSATRAASGTVSTSTYGGGSTPAPTPSCGVYRNTGKFTASNHGAANSNEAVTEVKCTAPLKPNLKVVKTADDDKVEVGTPIGFTIKVTNAGPGVAQDVRLLDILQPGFGIEWELDEPVAGCTLSTGIIQTLSCSFGDLPAGATRTVQVVSPTDVMSKGIYINVVKVWADNHDHVLAGDKIVVDGYSRPCVNGCSASYWKSKTGSWTGYQTGQKFNQVFGVNLVGANVTLLDALKPGGDADDALAREAVAALLNAANPKVSYGPSPEQVVKIVQAAVRYRKYDLATYILKKFNDRNCPLR